MRPDSPAGTMTHTRAATLGSVLVSTVMVLSLPTVDGMHLSDNTTLVVLATLAAIAAAAVVAGDPPPPPGSRSRDRS